MHLKITLWGTYLSQFADGKTGAFFFFKAYLLIYLWLHRAFVASLRLSPVVESRAALHFRSQTLGMCKGSAVVCGTWAWLPHSILAPQSRIKLRSPALAGRFLTTRPPGKARSLKNFVLLSQNQTLIDSNRLTAHSLRSPCS